MIRASLNRAVRLAFAALLLLTSAAQIAGAASFSGRRGINMDIWTTWPARATWGDEKVLLPFPEWRRHVSDKDLRQLKADGFDYIRMPVDPTPFAVPESAALQERLLESVRDSARAINAAGLKVVVDLHPFGGSMEAVMSDPAMFDRYVELVRAVGRILADEDPAMVAFELMNEPVVDCSPGQNSWPDRQKRLFAAARASAPKLSIILTGACWSGGAELAKMDPGVIVDDNVLWTFHSYEPFLLTSQGASWAGDFIQYVTGLPYPLSSFSRAEREAAVEAIRQRIRDEAPKMRRAGLLSYLDEQVAEIDSDEKLAAVMDKPFDAVAAWADRNGVARQNILLGEFGLITQDYGKPFVTKPAWRAAYASDVIARAEARGFGWSIWGYGGSFGVIDGFDGEKADPAVLDVIRSLPPPLRTTLAN